LLTSNGTREEEEIRIVERGATTLSVQLRLITNMMVWLDIDRGQQKRDPEPVSRQC
jgi:hypothetical protein